MLLITVLLLSRSMLGGKWLASVPDENRKRGGGNNEGNFPTILIDSESSNRW